MNITFNKRPLVKCKPIKMCTSWQIGENPLLLSKKGVAVESLYFGLIFFISGEVFQILWFIPHLFAYAELCGNGIGGTGGYYGDK